MKSILRGLLTLSAFANFSAAQIPLAPAAGKDDRAISDCPFYPIQALLNNLPSHEAKPARISRTRFASGPLEAIGAARDVYIALRTDAPSASGPDCAGQGGSGLPIDPCDGSTQTKFDAIMAAQPEYARISLGEGTFETNGFYGWHLLRGMTISGRGTYQTTLKQVYAPLTDNYNFGVISGRAASGGTDGDEVEIRDFTIDCNYDALQPLTVAALGPETKNASIYGVVGRSGLIQNVRVIHSGGNLETFCISLASQGPVRATPAERFATSATRSEIRGCLVELPSKIHHALTAICIFSGFHEAEFDGATHDLLPYGGTGVIEDCVVDGGPYGTVADCKIAIAYQGSGFNSLRIENCYARNASYGYYHDTGPQRNLEIANCTFDGVSVGIEHFGGFRQDATFGRYHHNLIISFDRGICPGNANQTTVEHNRIRPVIGATLNPASAFVFQQRNADPAVNLDGNVYRYNRIHLAYQAINIEKGAPIIYGNRYFDGGAVDSLKDNIPPWDQDRPPVKRPSHAHRLP